MKSFIICLVIFFLIVLFLSLITINFNSILNEILININTLPKEITEENTENILKIFENIENIYKKNSFFISVCMSDEKSQEYYTQFIKLKKSIYISSEIYNMEKALFKNMTKTIKSNEELSFSNIL